MLDRNTQVSESILNKPNVALHFVRNEPDDAVWKTSVKGENAGFGNICGDSDA